MPLLAVANNEPGLADRCCLVQFPTILVVSFATIRSPRARGKMWDGMMPALSHPARAPPASGADSPEAMDKAKKTMLWVGWGLAILLIVVWPVLALPAGVFSKVRIALAARCA